MSISTLSKITVPLASGDSAANQGLLMPKLQYRFRVSLQNFGVTTPTTELTKQVVDVTRPTVAFEPIEIPVYNSKDIIKLAKGVDVIALDEAQFFDENIVSVCNNLANDGKRVIIAGLDMDFEGNPFGPMPNLMAVAEFVTKVHAICTETGNLANFSHRTSKSKDLVFLGERNEYEPLSRSAFYEKFNKS